jgi:tyrosinase
MVKKIQKSSPRLTSAQKVEMIIRGTKPDSIRHHQILARQISFRFNVPSENIISTAKTIQRKDQADMTQIEKDRYINGIRSLINSGRYGSHVAIHTDMSHRQHSMSGPIGTQRFLPWHRVYLFELEQMLLAIDPDSFVPYWDWTKNRDVPQWLQDFTPTVLVNGHSISVFRTPGQQRGVSLPTQQEVDNLNSINEFTKFTRPSKGLEGLHNNVHVWVGGTMNDLMYSPSDCLFWLHHANVDRIWFEWQKKNHNKNPILNAPDAIMDPWSFNEEDTRDLANFGYEYV